MPTLHWVGKDKVVNHHHDVPFRLLNKGYTFKAQDNPTQNSTENRIIHGDNLEALKSLLPEFEGKVKCIYIDPPYNTGKEGWVYNDNVNDPKIKKWLGQVVGKEGEDLSRHDKWLCMMYPRLKLLHKLLADDGVIFISINDIEVGALRVVCDEIFGVNKRIETFTWKTEGNFDNQAKIKNNHEYILMYSKNPEVFSFPDVVDPNTPENSKLFKPIIRNTIVKNGIKNPQTEVFLPIGFPADVENGIVKARKTSWPYYSADCQIKNFKSITKTSVFSGWSSLELLLEFIENDCNPIFDAKGQETRFVIAKSGALESIKNRQNPSHVVTSLSNMGSTQSASTTLAEMAIKFSYPKPPKLIEYLLKIVNTKEDEEFIVLDSFAGTGTTAHAVLKLNAQDGGNRRFICIEMMDYAETITAERVRRVMNGYGEGNKAVAGLGGGFDFYTVGEPLFLEDKNLNEAVGAAAIRDYVAYTESIPNALRTDTSHAVTPYALGAGVGLADSTLWVFYYERERVTTLDMAFIASLNIKALLCRPEVLVIYADKCTLDRAFMTKHRIVFKRIPRDITKI